MHPAPLQGIGNNPPWPQLPAAVSAQSHVHKTGIKKKVLEMSDFKECAVPLVDINLSKIENPDNEHVSQRSRCSTWENGTLWRVFGSHKGGAGSSLTDPAGTK